ncbi:hypothetical protein EIN_495670 [Entamoeba invadens IP1]|uniref:Uncharacterized protein n=1 Tax=Entamoeba invadens IP1 TaxID=370355 RepID=A0A0A1TZP8_ENTIV|nr:hypothetical protein EIN_495670 [Entamoeba invadens IP1]ELP87102.1 hypothetical protein EIN_495670 [Entamoeba invadens IP1]|eukprot:XP_004253873.1 hypothetical protein EIN_495670 [Entamoeba invadens IP1]
MQNFSQIQDVDIKENALEDISSRLFTCIRKSVCFTHVRSPSSNPLTIQAEEATFTNCSDLEINLEKPVRRVCFVDCKDLKISSSDTTHVEQIRSKHIIIVKPDEIKRNES